LDVQEKDIAVDSTEYKRLELKLCNLKVAGIIDFYLLEIRTLA
jgi:hypothetical protein